MQIAFELLKYISYLAKYENDFSVCNVMFKNI